MRRQTALEFLWPIVPALWLAACAQAPVAPATTATSKVDDARLGSMLVDARALLDAKRPDEAITKDLDPVIAAYDAAYGGSRVAYYSSRSVSETLVYMVSSVVPPGQGRPDVPGGPSAVALGPQWGDALYLKGYALIELHRLHDAHEPFERAVKLAPRNAQYLAELAQLFVYERNWPQARTLFERAADAAELSPPSVKTKELTRAWRGIGYVDIETGRLDDAAALYERCLALNPDDATATSELKYVRAQQAKAAR